MEEFKALLDALGFRDLTKGNIALILKTIDKHDIDDDDVDTLIEEFAVRVGKPFVLVDNKIFGEEREKQEKVSKLKVSKPNDGIYSAEDMKTPWNIIEDLGYNIYQDNASQKDLYWIKSKKVIGDKKTQITKTTKESLINLLNSWAYEHQLKWNKPVKDTQGNITDFNEVLIDFKDADLTRFFHKQIVFDPTTTSNLCMFQGKECLNSYTTPTILHFNESETVEIPDILENFYLLLYNITGQDEDGTEYVLQWLARNYQTKEKSETMLIFAGESGTGKGVLVDILTMMYGVELVGKGTARTSIFTKEENSALKDKLYYHADEIVIDKDNWSSVKAFTGTNKTFLLKELYANSRMYPNWANFIFNINTHKGDLPFKIPEQKDRRMCCFETFTPLKDLNWWDDSRNGTYEFFMSPEFITELAKFLSAYPYSDELLSKPYHNDLRERMLKAGQSSVAGFAKALLEKDFDWLDDNGLDTISWYNANGKRAKGYDWHQHLEACYRSGFITLKDAKTLFTQLFPDSTYKTSQMIMAGMVEKIKPIEHHDGVIRRTRYFELPNDKKTVKKSLEEKLKGEKDE